MQYRMIRAVLSTTLLTALSLVVPAGPAQAVITPPTCPADSLTRTGSQTTGITADNTGGTWDLTGATWTNTSLGYPVNATAMTNGCIEGGEVDGGVSKTSTRDEWYDGVVASDEPDNRDAYTVEMTNASNNWAVLKNTYAEDWEDAYDMQTLGTNTSVYLDHVEANHIGDDCIENEGSGSSPDTPAQHIYVKDSLFDGCFTGIGWRPGATGTGIGGNANASLTIEDSLMRISAMPLGSEYCTSTKLTNGRCQSASTSVSDSGMVGLYGIWKWSEDAPIGANVTISNTIFRVDAQSYSSCTPWRWPAGGTYSNVTLVWAGAGSYNSLCSASSYPLPSGVTLTTDTSVWDNAVAAWRNGGGNPPPTNQAPTVNAGVDQVTTLSSTTNLDGTVSDDGLPSGSSVSSTWSKVSGPGTVTFGNASSVDTTVSFSAIGTYVLQLSATDGTLTTTDTVQILVDEEVSIPNAKPSVDAGPDQTITLPDTAQMSATVTDPENDPLTYTWSEASGPAAVTFSSRFVEDPVVTFTDPGTYVLELEVQDDPSNTPTLDYVTVTVNAATPPTNTAPFVDVGGDETGIACGRDATGVDTGSTCAVQLNGYIEDAEDGEPGTGQVFNGHWSVIAPSGLTSQDYEFFDSDDASTRVYFAESGTYTLRLSYTDSGGLSASDTLDVVVSDPPPPPGVTYVGGRYSQGSSNSVTATLPIGLQNGDTVVFFVAQNQGYDRALQVPAGVTALGAQVNDGSSLGARLYTHTVSASTPTSFTFTTTGTDTAYQLDVSTVAYRNVTSITQVTLAADTNSDALHSVSGTTASDGVNLVFASQHKYVSGDIAEPSTYTLGSGLMKRVDNGQQSSNAAHAMSQVAGDTGSVVTAGSKSYSITANQTSPYAISALVNLQ